MKTLAAITALGIAAVPSFAYAQDVTIHADRAIPGQPLVSIPGQPPTSGQRGTGCPFKSRCRVAISACDAPLPLVQLGTIDKPQLVACHRVSEVA